MHPSLLIVVATYNEIDTLPVLVDKLFDQLPTAHVLVIDDHSPDGTGNWCDTVERQSKRFKVIHRSGKLGLGTATVTGLKVAMDQSYELVATLDADLSHDPATLAAMVQRLDEDDHQKYGVIIGSRYIRGGEIHGWPWYRLIASSLVNQYARFVLRLPTRDNTSAMRVYRTQVLAGVDLDLLQSPGYAYLEEILVLLKQHGVQFVEHPIIFRNREQGDSKVTLGELASSLSEIMKLSFRSYKTR